jgi:hypothetical protein
MVDLVVGMISCRKTVAEEDFVATLGGHRSAMVLRLTAH